MSGITVPTLDEITGHTVMAKLRSLCKRFIGLAQEVDDKIDAPLEEAHLAVETANATLATAQESLEDAQDAVTTANSASETATEASESAQESAETVAGYDTRLTAVENGKINITDINEYAVGLTGNQDYIGIKRNVTVGIGSVYIGGNALRWVRIAYSTENEIAFSGITLADKHVGSNRSMEFYCLGYTSSLIFKYRKIFAASPNTDNFAFTYDGTKYELWYHYSTVGTNERLAVHMNGTNFRNFNFDGITTRETLDPTDFTIFVNPTEV